MNRAQTRRLRAEIRHQAERCEYWLRLALEREADGNDGDAFCLRLLARYRADAAFRAAAELHAAGVLA